MSNATTTTTGDAAVLLEEAYALSDEHRETYEEKGWVRLDGVLPRALALAMRDQVLQGVPPEGREDLTPQDQNFRQDLEVQRQHHIFKALEEFGPEFDLVTFSHRLGSIGRGLLGASEVQVYRSNVFDKQPERAGGGATKLHQDFPYVPMDRSRALSVWVALGDLEPSSGILRFVDGSHRLGSLGRDEIYRKDRDYLLARYESEGWERNQPEHLRAGDALAFADLTVHGSDPNSSSERRIALSPMYFDAATLYTGAPHAYTDGLGMEINQPFPRDHFPVAR